VAQCPSGHPLLQDPKLQAVPSAQKVQGHVRPEATHGEREGSPEEASLPQVIPEAQEGSPVLLCPQKRPKKVKCKGSSIFPNRKRTSGPVALGEEVHGGRNSGFTSSRGAMSPVARLEAMRGVQGTYPAVLWGNLLLECDVRTHDRVVHQALWRTPGADKRRSLGRESVLWLLCKEVNIGSSLRLHRLTWDHVPASALEGSRSVHRHLSARRAKKSSTMKAT